MFFSLEMFLWWRIILYWINLRMILILKCFIIWHIKNLFWLKKLPYLRQFSHHVESMPTPKWQEREGAKNTGGAAVPACPPLGSHTGALAHPLTSKESPHISIKKFNKQNFRTTEKSCQSYLFFYRTTIISQSSSNP